MSKNAKKWSFFYALTLKVILLYFLVIIWHFLRSLKTGALGNRLSRHGLATALLAFEERIIFGSSQDNKKLH